MTVAVPWALPPDVAAAAAASALLLLLSFASAACVLYLRLRASRALRRRRRVLLGLSSLWPARLLLSLFAALWAAAELLPLQLALPRWRSSPSPTLVCRAHALASHSLCEPCFFATLLFLLRASTSRPHLANQNHSCSAAAFAAALAAALSAALPFLVLHGLYLTLAPWLLPKLRLPPELLGTHVVPALGQPHPYRPMCAYPLFGTVLLAALAAVYVPLFVSACWAAVALVINKRLCVRLYALATSVVAALLLQVAALALSALCSPWGTASRALALAASVAVLSCAGAGVGILVIRPALDALAICEPQPRGDIEDDRHDPETMAAHGDKR